MKKTKIVCSIGPASDSVEVMSQMVLKGMNVARINFSHATLENRRNVVEVVKKVREATGKNVGILFDTKGPEFRSGMLENDEITLVEGKSIRLLKESILGNENRISTNHASAIASLKIGDIVLLENGLMKLTVSSIEEDGVTCLIENGGILGNKKSMSAPGTKLDIPFISEADREDILYAAQHDGDFLALSFVTCKEEVLAVRQLLKENNCEGIELISKIESQTGIDNIDEIIQVSDGIMVARGDLGVEVEMSELPFIQKDMIEKCRKMEKIVIVATEMLESMKKNIRPTRAEISDISSAVMAGTDAVMLSGETTVGNFPIETVENMAKICETAEKYYHYSTNMQVDTENPIRKAICGSAVFAAKNVNAKLIVTASLKGTSSRAVSNLLPVCPVLATVTEKSVATKLSLNYGVYPVLVDVYDTTDEIVKDAIKHAVEFAKLEDDDVIIITGGLNEKNKGKSTNFLKIETI
ncbi:MAG: pyruvate kinase [Mycoplasmatota bacterium]